MKIGVSNATATLEAQRRLLLKKKEFHDFSAKLRYSLFHTFRDKTEQMLLCSHDDMDLRQPYIGRNGHRHLSAPAAAHRVSNGSGKGRALPAALARDPAGLGQLRYAV